MTVNDPGTQPQRPGRLHIGIIGAGRVGAVLGAALRAVGHTIVAVSGASQETQERVRALLPGVPIRDPHDVVNLADVVIVAVPDDALAGVISGVAALGLWQPRHIVVHTSGAHGVAVLEPAVRAGALPVALHPAMTFTGTSLDLQRLSTMACAVTAPPACEPIGLALAVELGAEPVVVAEEHRGLYHAALAHGANHVVVLIAQAAQLLAQAGVEQPGSVLGPLMHAAVEGALRGAEPGSDPLTALTGPVVRGDSGTVARHLGELVQAAVVSHAQDSVESYRVLARAATSRALMAGRLSQSDAQRLLDVLHRSAPCGDGVAGTPQGDGE